MVITLSLLFLVTTYILWRWHSGNDEYGITKLMTFGYVPMRFCYFFEASSVGMAIYNSVRTNDSNNDKVYQLEAIAGCMDEQTSFNSDVIVSDL